MFSSAVILIPAKNEEASVAAVIREIQALHRVTIIIIDDASTDATVERARDAGAIVLPLSVPLGAWGAIQAGLRFAEAGGYQYAITMDADGQHEAVHLRELIAPVMKRGVDVSIGTCVSRASSLRRLAWAFLKRISGLSLADVTSGFRVYNRRAIELLAHRNATLLEYQDIGVLAMLCEKDFTLCEIPVSMRHRTSGHSRIFNSWTIVAYYMLHTSVLGVSKRRLFSCRVLTDK